MVSKITAFFSQFTSLKHYVAVAYGVLFALYETNPTFSGYINTTYSQIYSSLPHWLGAFFIGFVLPLLAFYHVGLKAPASASSTSTVKAAVALALVGLTLGLTTGCTQTSTQQAVKDIEAYLPTVEALANEAVTVSSMFDGASQQQSQQLTAAIDNGITQLEQLGNTYLSQPTSSNWTAIVNLVDSIVTSSDSQLLAAAHITDPTSQAKATALLGALDVAVHALDAIVQKAQPTSAVVATANARKAKLSSLVNYWPKDQLTPANMRQVQLAESYGF